MYLGIHTVLIHLLLLVHCLDGSVLVPKTELKSQKNSAKIAMCRAYCLNKTYLRVQGRQEASLKSSNCHNFQCWRNCEAVYSEPQFHTVMCGRSHCNTDCEYACKFYEKVLTVKHDLRRNRFIFPRKMTFEKLQDGVLITWSKPLMKYFRKYIDNIVYVVTLSNGDGHKWIDVNQTCNLHQAIPEHLLTSLNIVRVIAVTDKGIIAQKHDIYVHSVVGDMSKFARDEGSHIFYKWNPTLVTQSYNIEYSEVEAIVTWQNMAKYFVNFDHRFEVSWKIKNNETKRAGIQITGHLYTEANYAVLSLQPDAMYEIQVEFHSDMLGTFKSEPLTIHTKDIIKPNPVEKLTTKFCEGCDLKILVCTFCLVSFITSIVILKLITKKMKEASVKLKETVSAKGKEISNYEEKFFDEKLFCSEIFKNVHHKDSPPSDFDSTEPGGSTKVV